MSNLTMRLILLVTIILLALPLCAQVKITQAAADRITV